MSSSLLEDRIRDYSDVGGGEYSASLAMVAATSHDRFHAYPNRMTGPRGFRALLRGPRGTYWAGWPKSGSGYEDFLEKLQELRGQVDSAALAKAISLVTRLHSAVLDGHAGVDEDDIVLFWVHGRRSVEIDLSAAGKSYVRITNADGNETFHTFTDELPINSIRAALLDMRARKARHLNLIRDWD